MKRATPLKEFCDRHSQKLAADVIGVTRGAISQMLDSGRAIFLEPAATGWRVYEVKEIKGRRKAA